jgi:hypothetical protein
VGLLRPFILANFRRAFECYCRDKVARNAPFYPRLLRSRPPSFGLLTTVDLSGPVSRGTGSLSPRSRALLPRRGAKFAVARGFVSLFGLTSFPIGYLLGALEKRRA